jgi:hypothetical protein
VNGPMQSRRRFFFLLAPLLLGSIAIPAAGSEAAEGKPSAAQVAEGLKGMQHHVEEVAEYAGADKAKAQKHWDEAHESWEAIEDTIRDTHKDSYVAYEAALESLGEAAKAGDAKKADEEAAALANTTKNYVTTFAAAGAARAADAAPAPAAAAAAAESAPAGESAPSGTLARTGNGASALTALAGMAFGLGGLAVIGGTRRRQR